MEVEGPGCARPGPCLAPAMLARTGVSIAFVCLSMVMSGCPTPEGGCTPGASVACTCTDGRTGAQVCQSDRTLGTCSCTGGTDAGSDAPEPSDSPLPRDVPGSEDVPELGDTGLRDAGRPDAGNPPCIRDVDWLMQIDTSASMAEEQVKIAAELPQLVTALATGDLDGDGTPEFEPVRSLHLGVITPDLGTSEVSAPSCDALGDDGILLRATGGGGSCPVDFPSRIFEFDPSTDDAAAFAADVSCVARAGTGGCGFEQQLEAALKALSPASATDWVSSTYVPPTFRGDTTGHGDGANDGFVREGSLLAVTLFTDEDDCSATDYGIFSSTDPRFEGTSLNLRCALIGDALHPLDRYVDGLLQLREDPRLLVFGIVTGVPVDLVGLDDDATYTEMLDDDRMANTPDDSMLPPSRLLPSCTAGDGSGVAYPARRLVSTARDLVRAGARTRVGSICAPTYRSDLSAMARAIVEGAPFCE